MIPPGNYGLRHPAGGVHPLPILHPENVTPTGPRPGERGHFHRRAIRLAPRFSQDSIIIMSELLREKT